MHVATFPVGSVRREDGRILRTVTRLVRLAPLAVGIWGLTLLMPAGRLSAMSCGIGYASEYLESTEANDVLFIGSVVTNGDPTVFDVYASLKGPIEARVEVHILEEFSISQREQAPGTVLLVYAIRQEEGTLIFGPCLRPQPIETRTAAEQLVAAVPGAEARSAFEMLPEASALHVSAVRTPEPSPPSAPASSEATEGAASQWPGQLALAGLVAIGGSTAVGLWLARRRPAALGLAAVMVVASLTLAVSLAAPPGGTTASPVEPPEPSIVASTARIERETIDIALLGDDPTRDGPTLAIRMERAGLGCLAREEGVDDWQSWECGGLLTAETTVRVLITSGLADPTVWSYSVTYELRGDVPIIEPIHPTEFGPFIAQVLDADRRVQLDEWLEQTWAIPGVSTKFDDFNARRQLAALHLDLQPTVQRP